MIDFTTISNQAEGVMEITIADRVDYEDGIIPFFQSGIAAEFREYVEMNNPKSIKLNINSVGGNVYEGVNIYSYLKTKNVRVTARVEGIAASIASIVLMAADTIEMGEGSFIMIHNPQMKAEGDANEMKKAP